MERMGGNVRENVCAGKRETVRVGEKKRREAGRERQGEKTCAAKERERREHKMALTRIVLPGAFEFAIFVLLHFLIIIAATRHDEKVSTSKHKQNRWTARAKGQRRERIK
jgi:hypothetical protein